MSINLTPDRQNQWPHVVAFAFLGLILTLVVALAISGGRVVVHHSVTAVCPPGFFSSTNYGCLQSKSLANEIEKPLFTPVLPKGVSPANPLPPAPTTSIDLSKIVTIVNQVKVLKRAEGQDGVNGYIAIRVPANQYVAVLTKINISDPEMYSYITLNPVSSKSILGKRVPLPEGFDPTYQTILEPSISN